MHSMVLRNFAPAQPGDVPPPSRGPWRGEPRVVVRRTVRGREETARQESREVKTVRSTRLRNKRRRLKFSLGNIWL